MRRQAVEQSQSQPQPAQGSWEELKVFAETLPAREAGQLPHSVLVHLKQRLGNSQRTRPLVRARAARDTGKFATVTSANFRILLQAADHPWRLFTEEEVEKLKTFVSGLKPQVDQCRRLTLDSSALWSKVRVFDGAEGDEGKTDDRGIYKAQFEEAWASIVASVEREVLEVIGLPNVHVYAKDPGTFGSNRPGYYDEETQTIYLTGGNLTMSSIRHEFGHHIEDQGPVEVWFGLALILNWLSGKRPLEPPPRGAIRQIYSIQRTAEDPDVGVPNLIYSATYYEDGGTELLSTSLENDVLGNLKPYINWPPGMRDRTPTRLGDCKCGPEFAYLLLHALRPEEMRAAGFPSPALLCV